ncbi:MAG: hypothetical protein H6531_05620 [Actinobacteria bacterium]|nr:hypothetical protein [Actinomycetota bacterium]
MQADSPLRRHVARVLALIGVLAVFAVAGPASAATPRLNWAALGDSYSSGTGLGDVTTNCDRDAYAYAPRASWDILNRDYRIQQDFVACADAATPDLIADQVPLVSRRHTVASLTIGGNDIGFGDKLRGCIAGFSCGPDLFSLSPDTADGPQTWDEIHDRLAAAYVLVRKRMDANGHLYVLTYPIPFARQSGGSCLVFDQTEQNAANALVTRLDDTIYWATVRANELLQTVHGRPGNVHFVDWRTGTRVENGYTIPAGYADAGRSFATYVSPDGLCNTSGRTPLINGFVDILGPNRGNSFHPNSTGYWLGAELVSAAIRAHQ